MKTVTSLFAVALVALVVTPTRAALITGVTASNSSAFNGNTTAIHTVDGSGLSGNQHGTGFQQSWFSSDATVPTSEEWIQWDLGQAYLLSEIHVWNLNQNTTPSSPGDVTAKGISQLDIYVSSAASPGDPEGAGATNWTLLQANAAFTQAPGVNTYTGFDLATEIGAALPSTPIRWVRFEVDSQFSAAGTDYVGLAEIQFTGVSVPVPTAMPAGLSLLALMAMRRR